MRRKAQISFLSNQKGASLVEYILLLVVSVSLVITLTRIFWQPFNGFLDSYLGGYTQCLLEVGELPVLGGETNVADLEECRARFSAGQADSNTGSRSTSDRDDSTSRSRQASRERERDNASNASSASGRSRRGGFIGDSRGRGTEGSADATSGKTTVVELDPAESKFFRTSGRSGGETRVARAERPQGKTLTFFPTDAEREQIAQLKKNRNPASEEIGSVTTPLKKMKVEQPTQKKKNSQLDEGFDFTFFLRLLFLLGVLILIFILLGGLFLQVRQTMRNQS